MSRLEMPLVSVVIPAYNPPLSLFSSCLNSVLDQNTPLEVIVVDDGSEQEVAGMLDRLAEQNKELRVIHQENGGVCAARNTGLQSATGEFVVFVDADDELAPGWLIEAVGIAEATSASVVMGKVVMTKQAPSRQELGNEGEVRIFEEHELWMLQRDFLLNTTELVGSLEYLDLGVYSKLFRRSCIDGLYFPVGITLSEDQVFNHFALRKACRYAVTDATAYYYRIDNLDSVTHAFHPDAIEMMMRSMSLIKQQLFANSEVEDAFAFRVLGEIDAALKMSAFSKEASLSIFEQRDCVVTASKEPLLKASLETIDVRRLPSKGLQAKAVMLKYGWCYLYSVLCRIKSRHS